jgi:hypothetical protein
MGTAADHSHFVNAARAIKLLTVRAPPVSAHVGMIYTTQRPVGQGDGFGKLLDLDAGNVDLLLRTLDHRFDLTKFQTLPGSSFASLTGLPSTKSRWWSCNREE